MNVDVTTEIVINEPLEQVADYVCDPDNVPKWYVNIQSVEWHTERPLAVGSQLAFVAPFLGRRFTYTYEVTVLIPGEKMVMRTAEGAFPMETTYTWKAFGPSRTRVRLRNRGYPKGFSKVFAPFMALAVRRANRKDLLRLKRLLEKA